MRGEEAVDEKRRFHILFGISGMEVEDAKRIVHSLEECGVPVSEYGLRYNKIGVVQYLDNNPVDVLIVSQHLEDRSPYIAKDFEAVAEHHEGLCLIPVLQNEAVGRELVHGLFQLGLYNAVYDDDAEYSKLAELILSGRKRKEAKIYYGIRERQELYHADYSSSVAYIEECGEEELEEHALHVIHMVGKEEFQRIMGMLSKERYIKLGQIRNEEIMPFFCAEMKESQEKGREGSARNWLEGILGKISPEIIREGVSILRRRACGMGRAGRMAEEGKGPPPARGQVIGTVSVFVTGLKGGCGKSHFAALMANYLARRGRTCIITNNASEMEGRLEEDVLVVEGLDNPEAFAMNYVIYDLGDMWSLSEDEYRELERATRKVLMCFPDHGYLKRIASLASSGSLHKEFAYVFDNVTNQRMKEIKRTMESYATFYLPLCDVSDLDAQVEELLEKICL